MDEIIRKVEKFCSKNGISRRKFCIFAGIPTQTYYTLKNEGCQPRTLTRKAIEQGLDIYKEMLNGTGKNRVKEYMVSLYQYGESEEIYHIDFQTYLKIKKIAKEQANAKTNI